MQFIKTHTNKTNQIKDGEKCLIANLIITQINSSKMQTIFGLSVNIAAAQIKIK